MKVLVDAQIFLERSLKTNMELFMILGTRIKSYENINIDNNRDNNRLKTL